MRSDMCRNVLETLREYESYMSGMGPDSVIDKNNYMSEDLRNAVRNVSEVLYEMTPPKDDEFIKFLSMEESVEVSSVEKHLHEWLNITERDAEILSKCFVKLDYNFERMMITIERCPEEYLFRRLLSELMDFAESMPSNFEKLISIYTDFAHLWGGFDPETGNYDHFINGIRAVKEHTEDLRWLYYAVEDYRSRKVIYGLVSFWLKLDFAYKNSICENNYDDYFDMDILKDLVTEDEVFVDCGAYIGDTAEVFFNNFRWCRKMYLYDMLPANLDKAREVLDGHDEIIYRNAGVGSPEQAGKKISVKNTETSTFSLDSKDGYVNPEEDSIEAPEVEVGIVAIDEDIKEKITFIKMDIEGAEINALMGARKHIINDHPKLAICTYHRYEHLWEIPKLIRSMSSDYKLYLRYNGAMNGAMASEHVVIAV